MSERDGEALALRLQSAKLKPNTAAEDADYPHVRGLDKMLYQRLLPACGCRKSKTCC